MWSKFEENANRIRLFLEIVEMVLCKCNALLYKGREPNQKKYLILGACLVPFQRFCNQHNIMLLYIYSIFAIKVIVWDFKVVAIYEDNHSVVLPANKKCFKLLLTTHFYPPSPPQDLLEFGKFCRITTKLFEPV
jgi:hypothetical protein